MASPLRIGVLASGRGSNLQAVLDAIADGRLAAEVALVVSDHEDAPALERARRAGVPWRYIPPGKYRTRLAPDAEAAYVAALREHDVEIVFLAGFMRVLHATFLAAFPHAIINIHPSLLPAFPGLDAQGQALAYGAKIAGATVHFVDGGVDQGPIIAQRAVPVHEDDTRDALADRILAEEHRLVVEVLALLAARRVHVEGRRVRIVAPDVATGSPVSR